MTDYNDYMEVGLYREEEDVVGTAGGGDSMKVILSQPIATNCHVLLRNKPLGHGYNNGVEDIEVTVGAHTGDHITANIASISSTRKIITLDANTWDGETVMVRYYSSGYGTRYWMSSVDDGDYPRAEHPDNILSTYNRKGHINPLEAGMVFDNAMGRQDAVTVTAGETTVLEYDMSDGSSTGNWSFSGKRPYYVTCVRVEAKESDMDTTKGVKVHIYEDGNEIVKQGGFAGIIINDTDNWLTSEYTDGVDTWYSANIYLGMMLCSDLKVTVETNGGNGDLANFHTFVMGWYTPDPLVSSDITESFTYHSVPAPCGLYTEKVYTVDSNISIDTEPRYLPEMDASLRTVPHARNEYNYGIEYIKNLTTDEFVTSSIKEVSDTTIYLDPTAASENDIVEMGYYSYDTLGGVAGLTPKAGDIGRTTDVDGLFRAIDRMDRVDFGKTNFSYGDVAHEFAWNRQFAQLDFGGDYFGQSSIVTNKWVTLLAFDPYNYNARVVDVFNNGVRSDYLDRDVSNIDETPFFVTGMHFACDETAITGGKKYANGIKFKISFHSGTDSVRQLNQSEVIYYPMASSASVGLGEIVPGAIGSSSVNPSNGAGPLFYIPFGLIRCYSFKIDAAVEGGEAFESIHLKELHLSGWMIED